MGLGQPTASNGARDWVGAPLPAITWQRPGAGGWEGRKLLRPSSRLPACRDAWVFGESAYARARERTFRRKCASQSL
jgi:hypothetical protein